MQADRAIEGSVLWCFMSVRTKLSSQGQGGKTVVNLRFEEVNIVVFGENTLHKAAVVQKKLTERNYFLDTKKLGQLTLVYMR